jgi:hypothetical protein
MTAKVIHLPERKPAEKPAEFPKDTAHFYCTHCKSFEFRVYVPGDLYCVGCKAFIKNLIVRKP